MAVSQATAGAIKRKRALLMREKVAAPEPGSLFRAALEMG